MIHPLAQQLPPVIEESGHARRVLQALRASRAPGWQFPGYYLGICFEELAPDCGRVSMPLGDHCRNSGGQVALPAIAVLADIAVIAAQRERAGAGARMATVSARLNFAPVGGAGRMVASAKRCLALDAVSLPLGVSLLTIEAGGAICCSGEATVAVLGEGHGTAPHPLPRENRIEDVAPLSPQELTPEEQEVLARARKAEWMPGPQAFLERFWGIVPQAGEGWAECVVYAGRHVANRVGDVQGGILLGLAAQTSVAALPRGWSLVDLSAQFVAAASGPWVLARAECIRRGRNIAFVDCRISDNAGRTTLKAQATLARSN